MLPRSERHMISMAATTHLSANFSLGSGVAIISDLMRQAEANGTLPRFIHGLVAATLEHRLNLDLPAAPINQPDRSPSGREHDKPADFTVGDVAIEITAAGPDDKHLRQATRIVRQWRKEAWIIVPQAHVPAWQQKLIDTLGDDAHTASVLGVEPFVGQNVAELAAFARLATLNELEKVFARYNLKWRSRLQASEVLVS